MNDKKTFIYELSSFCIKANACQRINLHHLDYVYFRGNEYLYIFVGAYGVSEKRINITANSNEAITRAFFCALHDWDEIPYMMPGTTFNDVGGNE